MKLIQVLLSQPQKELVSRVKQLNLQCNAHSRQQVTEELSKALLNKDRLTKSWEQLSMSEKHLLLQLCYRTSLQFISSDELKICLKKDDRGEFDNIVGTLKGNGWIYQDANYYWVLPLELQSWLHKKMYEDWSEEFLIVPQNKSAPYSAVNDVYRFLEIVSDKKIALTKNNIIYKKELTYILSQLSKKELLPDEKWRFGYGRHFQVYPDCFSFLYDFCFEQGWIRETDQLIVTKKWQKGQGLSVNELLNRMIRSYTKLYRRAIPQLPFIIEMTEKLLGNGDAIEKESFILRIKEYIDSYYYDKPRNIAEKRILQLLEYIHFLSSSKINGSTYLFLHPRFLYTKLK
ncbi:hypothetical protein ACERII_02480 [Evansella sp. AB-rgal1]|uniref:hypothetical protein n=1 Tax=Evansella sp. AB-rgal1 TaxID=3242696 RepID=UPI00359D17FA